MQIGALKEGGDDEGEEQGESDELTCQPSLHEDINDDCCQVLAGLHSGNVHDATLQNQTLFPVSSHIQLEYIAVIT